MALTGAAPGAEHNKRRQETVDNDKRQPVRHCALHGRRLVGRSRCVDQTSQAAHQPRLHRVASTYIAHR